ncbi:unnamed protein product [Rotaria magnacalcarata]|uniref:Peptidase S1 domain-containing protein n=2 Tax=Rotaria magnacalcarata TaxID=392030 RepID=A0A819E2W5_9BILA|nr:unnamed protein product [Rotaria magnacalcarata]CAF2075411.1 unnamed protein product [Rotaria magnacalcarata]CAF3843201.1 unnamed protein product [Rotaria magnacalcarata]CAF4153775.1 unnamed protein product [Rotaria magnacalcarata]
MSFFIVLFIFGLISANSGAAIRSDSGVFNYEIPIPRSQTRREYLQSVTAFWTPERIASARPMESSFDANIRMSSLDIQENEAENIERLLTPPAPLNLRAPVGPPAVGKIFFSFDKLTYMCSGSVVNAANRDTIVTAGHCVYNNTAKVFATNLIFMPHYENNVRPHGTFPARSIVTTQEWMAKVDYTHDVAVVVVDTNDEYEHVQDLAGAFGISLNAPEVGATHLFGYPVNSEKGEVMDTCNGQTAKPSTIVSMLSNNFKGMQITCGMNGGSSGGPWIRNYNSNTGSGLQVAVTSFGSSLAPGKIHGPLFKDANIGQLFNFAKNK